METNIIEPQKQSSSNVSASPLVCEYCHQNILPQYYFCPNCGNRVNSPLSTSIPTQIWIYFFSAILPMICFLTISKWQGWKYFKSKDKKTKKIGAIAITILVLSTIITIWLAYVWTEKAIQSSIDSINSDLNLEGL